MFHRANFNRLRLLCYRLPRYCITLVDAIVGLVAAAAVPAAAPDAG